MTPEQIVDHAKGIMNEFAKSLGLGELSFEEDDRCTLAFDQVVVNFQVDGDTGELVLYAKVGELPEAPSPTLLTRLLEANLFHRGTGGATLGIESEERLIVLARNLPVEGLDPVVFGEIVTRFVNAAEFWMLAHREVDETKTPEGPAEAEGQGDAGTFMIRA
jgi:hypothetical protein